MDAICDFSLLRLAFDSDWPFTTKAIQFIVTLLPLSNFTFLHTHGPVGNVDVMVCFDQGGLRSLSASRFNVLERNSRSGVGGA